MIPCAYVTTAGDIHRVATGAKINMKMICECRSYHCIIWKVWMVCSSVWFIKLWKFCGNILLKIISTVFSTVKERCDVHARMTALSVNTKTQYGSCVLQHFEWSVYATICNVAYSPVRTYRFLKVILRMHILRWQYTRSVISFLIFQHKPLGTMSGYFLIYSWKQMGL